MLRLDSMSRPLLPIACCRCSFIAISRFRMNTGSITRVRCSLSDPSNPKTALPHLRRLANSVGESVFLMILTGAYSRFLASAEASKPNKIPNRDGMIFPAHVTSAGLAMLAELSPSQLEKLYSPSSLVHLQGQLPTVSAMSAQLQLIRERGYALAAEQAEPGVTAVGCVLRWPGSQLSCGLSIAAPSSRFQDLDLDGTVHALSRSARAIEKDLTKHSTHLAS